MRSTNPADVWQCDSATENRKPRGSCSTAKKSAVSVARSVSKCSFPARNQCLFQAKRTRFCPGCAVECSSCFKRELPSTPRIFCISQVVFPQLKKNRRHHSSQRVLPSPQGIAPSSSWGFALLSVSSTSEAVSSVNSSVQ